MNNGIVIAATACCVIAGMAISAAALALDAKEPVRAKPLIPVVVTATSSERSLDNTPASVSVVDGGHLRSLPIRDLADAVVGTPGVSLSPIGMGRRGISIRGMNSKHTLFLVDGQRVSNSASAVGHSDFELGWVPAEAIEQVEIVRGPMSSLYGSEALGGIVNVLTQQATDIWRGSASVRTTTTGNSLGGDRFRTGVYAGGPLVVGKLGLNVWGEFNRQGGLRDSQDAKVSIREGRRADSGHVGLTWTPFEQQRVDVSLDAVNDTRKRNDVGNSPQRYSYHNEYESERKRYNLSHHGKWQWGESRLRFYKATLSSTIKRSDRPKRQPVRLADTIMEARLVFQLSEANQLITGAETRREHLEDVSVNRVGKEEKTHKALFVQDEIRLGKLWEVVVGSRFDHHQKYGWQTSPRTYVLYQPNETLTLKAGLGKGFKAPTLKQLSAEYETRLPSRGGLLVRGNPALRPETSFAYELGIVFTHRHWQTNATVFDSTVKNLIYTRRQPACNEPAVRECRIYQNVASARIKGLEIGGNYDLSEQWRFSGSYTYLDSRNRVERQPMPDRSRHMANLALEWSLSKDLRTRLQAEYNGAQYRSAILKDRPSYALLHWYLNYDLGRHLSLYAGVENLSDKRLANDDASAFGLPDDGRRYYLGATTRF